MIKMTKGGTALLSVGAFAIVMAGLGISYRDAAEARRAASEELANQQKRAAAIHIDSLRQQVAGLETQDKNAASQVAAAQAGLVQSLDISAATAGVLEVAARAGVTADSFSSEQVRSELIGQVQLLSLTLSAKVSGKASDLIVFTSQLSVRFPTGTVSSAIAAPSEKDRGISTLTVGLKIYSYPGGQNNG